MAGEGTGSSQGSAVGNVPGCTINNSTAQCRRVFERSLYVWDEGWRYGSHLLVCKREAAGLNVEAAPSQEPGGCGQAGQMCREWSSRFCVCVDFINFFLCKNITSFGESKKGDALGRDTEAALFRG